MPYAQLGGLVRQAAAGSTWGNAAAAMPRYQSSINAVGAASAGSGIIGSIISGITTNKNVKRQIKAQIELADKAYNRDLEMWNRANAYNTPAAQMQRFKDAGLNPHLIYGKGSPGNAAQTMPQYQTPEVDYTKRVSPVAQGMIAATPAISAYNNYRLGQAQHDNVKANTSNLAARTTSELLKAAGQATDNKTKAMLFRLGNETYDYQVKRASLENDRLDAAIAAEKERYNLLKEQKDATAKQRELNQKRIEELDKRIQRYESGLDNAPWFIQGAWQQYGKSWIFGDDDRYNQTGTPERPSFRKRK